MPVQPLELGPGIGAQLSGNDPPGLLERRQRLGWLAGLGQGAHQQVPEPLPQRMSGGKPAQLGTNSVPEPQRRPASIRSPTAASRASAHSR
jgi:hypothetical protein